MKTLTSNSSSQRSWKVPAFGIRSSALTWLAVLCARGGLARPGRAPESPQSGHPKVLCDLLCEQKTYTITSSRWTVDWIIRTLHIPFLSAE